MQQNDVEQNTGIGINESILRNGCGAICGIAGSHPYAWIQGRPEGDHPIDVGVM